MLAVSRLTPAADVAASAISQGTVWTIVAFMSVAFALSAWARAGLYCNHQDMSPKCVLPNFVMCCTGLEHGVVLTLHASMVLTVLPLRSGLLRLLSDHNWNSRRTVLGMSRVLPWPSTPLAAVPHLRKQIESHRACGDQWTSG